jgi:DNA-binding NarL/FixJ family response regulator
VDRRRPKSPSAALAAAEQAPSGLQVSQVVLGTERFAVLSFPLAPISLPESLSDAERAVARALLAGASNRQIAAARRTSVRTVANQMASLLRKLGARSRMEAIAAIHQSR